MQQPNTVTLGSAISEPQAKAGTTLLLLLHPAQTPRPE